MKFLGKWDKALNVLTGKKVEIYHASKTNCLICVMKKQLK